MPYRNEYDRNDVYDRRVELTQGRPCDGKESFRSERQALAKLAEILEHKSHRDRLPIRAYECTGRPTETHAGGCWSWHLTSTPDRKEI